MGLGKFGVAINQAVQCNYDFTVFNGMGGEAVRCTIVANRCVDGLRVAAARFFTLGFG